MKLTRVGDTLVSMDRVLSAQLEFNATHQVRGVSILFDTGQQVFVTGEDVEQSLTNYKISTLPSSGTTNNTSDTGTKNPGVGLSCPESVG